MSSAAGVNVNITQTLLTKQPHSLIQTISQHVPIIWITFESKCTNDKGVLGRRDQTDLTTKFISPMGLALAYAINLRLMKAIQLVLTVASLG